ncbi:MAG: hypothetical protein ACI30O_00250 [Muribaculaceae bacterium]
MYNNVAKRREERNERRDRRRRINIWMCIGVAVLIILLLLWLTWADLLGDTDVGNFVENRPI